MLKQQMHHVKCMILVPDMTDRMAKNGINIIDAAGESGVKRIQMMSRYNNHRFYLVCVCMVINILFFSAACEFMQENQGMFGQMLQLERHLREEYCYGRWCIFRMSFLHQFFYIWNRMIEHRGCIGMPISKNAGFTCISIHDVCDAVATLLLSPKKQDTEMTQQDNNDDYEELFDIPEQAVKRVYQLTGRCPYTGEDIAVRLNEAVGAARGEITFSQISAKEMREYLETTAGIRTGGPSSWLESIVRRFTVGGPHRDRPGLVPDPHKHLTAVAIDMTMQYFEMIKEGHMAKVTNDLRDLVGREPLDLKEFFYENRHEFRRPSHRGPPQ